MERLLIATSDDRQGELLRRYLAAGSARFELHCTSDRRILKSALNDESISAVVTDTEMMALLGNESISPESNRGEQKPVLNSPVLSQMDSIPGRSPVFRQGSDVEDLRLFKIRLNNAIDVWRRSHSDRRIARGNALLVGALARRDPATGFVWPVDVEGLVYNGNPSHDRRQIISCVTLTWTRPSNDSSRFEEMLRVAANRIRQNMGRCDLGVRWDENTLVILRPSSPMGESWLWGENMRRQLDALSPGKQRSIVAGISVLEVPTAEFSQKSLQDGVAAAARSARYEAGCMQTPLLGQLATGRHWEQLRKLSARDRRSRLLDLLRRWLGSAQIEHVGPHCESASRLAGEIAIACKLDGRGIENARLAGLYHDLGKILVPNDILAKPGPLSPPERMLIEKHVSWGVNLCEQLDMANPICDAVRNHHARFNETGYGVSICARIVTVADAMATMAARRDYCRAQPGDYVLAELRRERGGQFDPQVVDVVCSSSICVNPNYRWAVNN